MTRRSLTLGLTLALIAGCAAPSDRIATGLTRYGLDPERAGCVGADLASRLSLGQLQQLGRAAQAYRSGDADPATLTATDLLRVAGELKDPEVPLAAAAASVGCGVITGTR